MKSRRRVAAPVRSPGAPFLHRITLSPIILSYPGAVLFTLDGDTIGEISYRETKHFLITRDFLNSPERFFKHLFGTVDDHGRDTYSDFDCGVVRSAALSGPRSTRG
jgi:hypothetical protein